MSVLNTFVQHFGFDNFTDFSNSMIHAKFLILTIPTSLFTFGFVEKYLGLTPAIFFAFFVLAVLELVTGLVASRARGEKWESRKFSRFGLKILVWLCLIMVAFSFKEGYETERGLQAGMIFQIFHWLHGVLIVYISFEYLISILENFSRITGKSNNKLITILKKKFDQFLGAADEYTTPKGTKDPLKEEKTPSERIKNPKEVTTSKEK